MKVSNFFITALVTFILFFSACSGGSDSSVIIHNGGTYSTVHSPYTGKVWLDRNLGALRSCVTLDDMACYGDYYQWGRNYDGHQKKSSDINSTLATDESSAGENFITTSAAPYDWVDALVDDFGDLRNFNWSKIDGESVCPVGYRVPTITELRNETLDNNASDPFANNIDAFNNFLKFPSAGKRDNDSGDVTNVSGNLFLDEVGVYLWLNSVDVNQSYYLNAMSDDANISTGYRANGFSIRCIED